MGVKHINWLHLEIQLKRKSLTNKYTKKRVVPPKRSSFFMMEEE